MAWLVRYFRRADDTGGGGGGGAVPPQDATNPPGTGATAPGATGAQPDAAADAGKVAEAAPPAVPVVTIPTDRLSELEESQQRVKALEAERDKTAAERNRLRGVAGRQSEEIARRKAADADLGDEAEEEPPAPPPRRRGAPRLLDDARRGRGADEPEGLVIDEDRGVATYNGVEIDNPALARLIANQGEQLAETRQVLATTTQTLSGMLAAQEQAEENARQLEIQAERAATEDHIDRLAVSLRGSYIPLDKADESKAGAVDSLFVIAARQELIDRGIDAVSATPKQISDAFGKAAESIRTLQGMNVVRQAADNENYNSAHPARTGDRAAGATISNKPRSQMTGDEIRADQEARVAAAVALDEKRASEGAG